VNVGELPAIHFAADDRDHVVCLRPPKPGVGSVALHISIARQAIAGLCVPHA
jgi:hypothetical protein